MSLVGSLEDLGLGDILQIISLSRKSGVLWLRSERGEGRILFREGRVVGAFRKGGPADLRSLAVASGAASEAEYEAAVRRARQEEIPLDEALGELPGLAGERLEELRKRHVERAAFAMFSWPTGEFSFDVRDDVEEVDPALCVTTGIDAQYLAMEGARLRDEEDRDAREAADASDPASFADLGAELRGESAAPAPAPEPELELETLAEPLPDEGLALEAEAVAEPVDEAEIELEAEVGDAADAEAWAEVVAEPVHDAAAEALALATAARAGSDASAAAPAAGARAATPVVVVDPELALLEWAKAALGQAYERVHIFQKTELAIARIRQYVVRRETPIVVLSDATPRDPNSGASSPAEIVSRLKAQVTRLPVLALALDLDAARGWGADAVSQKPTQGDLYNPRRASQLKAMAGGLREGVAAALREAAGASGRVGDPGALARLKQVSAQLREAAPRGQIIPVVLRFAADHFARVALFLVRDELAVGMAQSGLARAGGPDDTALRDLAIRADAPAWFRAVFETRAAVRGPASDEGDRQLARLLGERVPTQAYVAPLESGDQVVALLYADNLPGSRPLPDTAGLEVVLHEAGLALDRAALERQLAEVESRRG